jgi:hypothetical protein
MEPENVRPRTIQDVFTAFEKGEITEKEAVKLLEEMRASRHGPLERYLSFLATRS